MNKRQRKKLAKKQALKTGAYTPRNTFRSTMSIQSTLFDPNHPKNEKMIYLAERNLNRLAFVITKPGVVNLTNLTEDDVKYLQSSKFEQLVTQIQEYVSYDRARYNDPNRIDNITRYQATKYFEGRNIQSTQGLTNALRRLIKELDKVTKQYGKGYDKRKANNPFVIVYYRDTEARRWNRERKNM